MENGKPKVIENSEGTRTTPSIVAYTDDNEILVGASAKRQAVTNPKNTLFAVKRLIGRRFDEDMVQRDIKMVPYSIVRADNNDAWVEVRGRKIAPPEISAQVLIKMKKTAEDYLGEAVSEAVITVPAYFNDSQRQATKDAGRIAGLEVKRIINEPTAAALAFGMDKKEGDRKIAVYDLGGGTFDISIIEIAEIEGEHQFEVLATNGDTFLGGEDFDLAIVQYLIEEFNKLSGRDLTGERGVMQRFKEAAQKAKHDLSYTGQVEIDLPFVQGLEHMSVTLGRKQLEGIVRDSLRRLEEPCLQALDDARLTPADITDVILVGGMTRMPAVKSCAAKIFEQEPLDTIDPDEAVALGAAVQAGLLQGYVKGVSLLDVTSLSLGIEIQGARMHTVISRNTTVPTKKTEIFTTSAPNQPQVSIHVLQGESDFAPDNKSLGRFELLGVRPAPRGVPEIAVSFEIDAEGIVHVNAKDLGTGEEQSIEIIASSGLSDYEIDKLVRDGIMAEEQKKRMEAKGYRDVKEFSEGDPLLETKRSLKNSIFVTQSKLNTEGREFKGRARVLLEDTLSSARSTLESAGSADELLSAQRDLEKRAHALDEFIESQW